MTDQSNFDFAPAYDRALSQYHTPPPLAERMAELLPVPCTSVLEPSAGGGNLVAAALAARKCAVTAVEIDAKWITALATRFELFPQVDVWQMDFLEPRTDHHHEFDAALMNPPLDDGMGVVHVAQALRQAPVVVSLLRAQDLHGQERHETFWARYGRHVDYLVHSASRQFKHAKSDFVAVRIDTRPGERQVELAWWR